MWFNLGLENTYLNNFNINFSSLNSDVLIHLTQWQYWWWFWFSLMWVFYFFLSLKTIRFRTLKMRPKIVTSFRPHGKWGDFLACTIPLVWCINILTNSNFILRLLEWQNESSLFTLRVRARQWYWIYKFELKNFTDIISAPKNIGNNKWQVNTFGDLQLADDYLHILQLRSQNKWIKDFWNNSLQDTNKANKSHIVSPKEQFKINLTKKYNYFNNINNYKKVIFFNKLELSKNSEILNYFQNSNINNYSHLNNEKNNFFKNFFKNVLINDNLKLNLARFEDFDEYSRIFKKNYSGKMPVSIIKVPVNNDNFNENILIKIRFNSNSNLLQQKLPQDNMYFTLKQKRYNRRKIIKTNSINYKINNVNYSPFLNSSKILENSKLNQTIQYNLIKKNKKKNEVFSVISNKRLLRTKKILVLPCHVNITIITNSYDIVHSWFIPGLGIKLDCVPGRSTHHTFFIDNAGFYYGQCAEICGRYHHHMPIKLCAVPFEHFLLWWNNFGLPKLFNTQTNNSYEIRKYNW